MARLSQRMVALGTARSEIREAFAFAQARAAVVGPENVDDFSIGNPSVPAPPSVAEAIHRLVDEIDGQGVPSDQAQCRNMAAADKPGQLPRRGLAAQKASGQKQKQPWNQRKIVGRDKPRPR